MFQQLAVLAEMSPMSCVGPTRICRSSNKSQGSGGGCSHRFHKEKIQLNTSSLKRQLPSLPEGPCLHFCLGKLKSLQQNLSSTTVKNRHQSSGDWAPGLWPFIPNKNIFRGRLLPPPSISHQGQLTTCQVTRKDVYTHFTRNSGPKSFHAFFSPFNLYAI